MNKKVLTLCAGMLLAGSMLSSANASLWESDDTYVLNTGKYHVLGITARYGSSEWEKSDKSGEYVLSTNEKGEFILTKDRNKVNAYWTITTVPGTGVYYQLKNANGETLKFTHAVGTADEQVIDKFRIGGESGDTEPFEPFNYIYYEAKVNKQNKKFYLQQGTTTGDVMTVTFAENNKDGKVKAFNNFEIAEEPINAADLNAKNKDGFYLNFKDYADIQGNVFNGKIQAIPAKKKDGVTDQNSHALTYYLYKPETNEYIVLTEKTWGEPTDVNQEGSERSAYQGYIFDTVSEHEWKTKYATETSHDLAHKAAEFQILKSYDFNNTDSLIVTMPFAAIGQMPGAEGVTKEAWDGDKDSPNWNKDKGVRVFVSRMGKINYLTVIEYAKANDRLAEQKKDAYADYQVGASAPYIEFGQGTQIMDIAKAFAGKLWNITTVDGSMIMSPEVSADIDSYERLFAPAKQVDLTNPEGQWLLNKDAEGYYFVNRESGAKFHVSKADNDSWIMRTTSTPDVYEICWKHQMITGEWRSIVIKEAGKPGKTENGYVNFDMAKEANNGKYMSFADALGRNVFIGKDADDNVILTEDQSQAIEFRIKQLDHDFTDHDGVAAPDTLQHYTTFLNVDKDGKTYTDVDTLQFFHYALYENFSEKYLTYDKTTKNFKLSKWSRTNNGHENFDLYAADHAFVVKEKEDGTRILVRDYAIDYDYCIVDGKKNHSIDKYGIAWSKKEDDKAVYDFDNIFEANLGADAYTAKKNGTSVNRREDFSTFYAKNYEGAHKVYAAYITGEITDNASLYNYEDNDRITVVNTDQVEYLNITGSQDTVKVALQDQPNFFLYEQGRFLGLEHVADVEDMAAAMLVDTAYVRNNTYRPQFLLAVDAYHVDEEWDNHPSRPQDIPHLIHPDTTYGRFLVNMVDSAVAYKGSVNTNPYIFDRNDYYRLAFVEGKHYNDTLYLNTANNTKIALGDNDDKVCTFAFRYVDNSRTGVKIETRYNTTADETPVRGWLKYQNNVAVVTDDYNDAHVFTVDNTTLEAPTANEAITAEGAVSVVATDGAVVIKGAEGKNVVIATILGKVVANETVNSDNETIAVPTGIAVVSVDGESFKVVVK